MIGYLKILLASIKNRWYIYKERTALNEAKRTADFMHDTHNGAKYIVLKDPYNNFVVLSKKDFEFRKVRGQFDKRIMWRDAVENAYYETKPR